MVLIITDLPDEDLHVAEFSLKGYRFDTSCELTVKVLKIRYSCFWDATWLNRRDAQIFSHTKMGKPASVKT